METDCDTAHHNKKLFYTEDPVIVKLRVQSVRLKNLMVADYISKFR